MSITGKNSVRFSEEDRNKVPTLHMLKRLAILQKRDTNPIEMIRNHRFDTSVFIGLLNKKALTRVSSTSSAL